MKIITVKTNNTFLPPFAYEYDKVEDQVITKLWQHRNPNGYIVDPLGYDQCVALMYEKLDKVSKWIFDIICGKVEYETINEKQYHELFHNKNKTEELIKVG